MFIPKINLPLEGIEHARWLEKRSIDQERAIAELRAAIALGNKQNAASARNSSTTIIGSGGLPPGGRQGNRLAKMRDTDYAVEWVENTVGGMTPRWFELPDSKLGTDVDLLAEWEAQLFDIQITSPSDNSTFSILLPDLYSFDRELALPFYVLSVYVYDHSIDLELRSTSVPTYLGHPDQMIMGATPVPGGGDVTLPAGFQGQWFVLGNFQGGNSVAIPMFDTFYTDRYGTSVGAGAAPAAAPTAAAGTGPTVNVDGTSLGGTVELVTGTAPTTTGWGELFTFSDPSWSGDTVPVLHLSPANQAAAGLSQYTVRAASDIEAHVNLTGVAASTTYLFNYSLLPFSAV